MNASEQTVLGVYKGVHVYTPGGEKPTPAGRSVLIKPYNVSIAGEGDLHTPPAGVDMYTLYTPAYTPGPLAAWITDARDRGIHATIAGDQVHLTGPASELDHRITQRHRNAILVGAHGTHPNWWNTVSGLNPTDLTANDLPTTPDPTTADQLAYACACCGRPADHIDPHQLPWCTTHR